MPFDINFFQNGSITVFLKAGFLLVVFAYIIFALIVLRQVFSMDSVVKEVHAAAVLKIFSLLLLLVAVWLFLSALAIL